MSAGIPSGAPARTTPATVAPHAAADATRSAGATAATSKHPGDRIYRLGRLPFALSGAGGCAQYLRGELESLRVDARESAADAAPVVPRIAFDFVRALPPLRDYTATAPVWATADAFRVAYNSLSYRVSAQDPADEGSRSLLPAIRVELLPDDQGRRYRWFSAVYRARDWNYLSSEETQAKNFMYGVFDYLTHVAQLELGQSYIHASSLARDGQGTAIVAWGGIGKTSAALKLITEHGFSFLSDDLGLVDDAGTLWRTPKRMQVYAYNLEGEDRLRSMLLDGRSLLDRASWEWKLRRRGPKGVRRRVSAEELFGERSVARSAPLARVFCLERGDVRDFEVREITADELARRAAEVVMHEIEPFGLVSRALHSGHHAPLLPTQDEVVAATRSVLRKAFDGIPALSIRIPLSTPPASLATHLLSLM